MKSSKGKYTKKQTEFPYGIGIAVIKQQISMMPPAKVEKFKNTCYNRAKDLPFGNQRQMYINLYQWCERLQKTPSNKR